MSGHSKWSTIKRQKGVADAKRGQLFTKLAKEIILAAKQGSPNPEQNYRLRLAIQKAKDSNMPSDNIERAIKKASGGAGGSDLVEAAFEGYGPGGVALLIQVLTDNRNRTLQEIRSVFNRGGGSMAEAGAVGWLFDQKGLISINTNSLDPEEVALWAIDAGAEDFKVEKGSIDIYTRPEDLEEVRRQLEEKNLEIENAEVSMLPKTTLDLDTDTAEKVLKLMEKIEELDDVQQVYSNADFSEEVMEKLRDQA